LDFWPLSKVIESKIGTSYLSIHPLAVENKDKSLAVFANVANGDRILLMQADWPLLLNATKTISQKAMLSNKITKDESIFGIFTYCAGKMLTIPPEERPKMPSLVSETIGKEVPFIGTLSFGEQAPLGIVNHHGNLINSIILFSE